MEVISEPAEVITKAAAGDEGQWSASAGWFDYDKDAYLELMVGNYIEWTPKDNLYCGEHRPEYRTHCHSELQPGASVVAKTKEPARVLLLRLFLLELFFLPLSVDGGIELFRVFDGPDLFVDDPISGIEGRGLPEGR